MTGPLPLFLLRTVLFPHMPMSLHVFEDRYQEMMRDSLDAGTSFGVVAIREGKEVDGDAVPRGVGTLARIVHVERLPDGRMNLLITGASRFRVVRRVDGKAYAQAEVEYLPEESEGVSERLVVALQNSFNRYLGALRQVARGYAEVPDLPSDPEALAYLVATTLETSLEARQQLLEATDAKDRIELELKILRHEQDLLSRKVLPSAALPNSFSLN
ncbi:MAG TPA: LON peptidase substrate-binding domain-containing protein [Candidatus Solibacter sp.]|jgi:Lon protease-like protein|nr:LON peptidase substrate-binding domain-containing protein [Candidatus Solibacter sp.]